MEKLNQPPLFDKKAAQYVLGCLMHQPNLVYDEDKYILSIDDFADKLYIILFGAIYNLSNNGAKTITPPNIDLYLSAYPVQYENYTKNDGLTLTQLIYEQTEDFDIAQFNFYYERIKKFSTLRELRQKGFEIGEFYRTDFLDQDKIEEEFNKLTVTDILNKIRNKIQLVENRNVSRQESTGQYAAKGIRDLMASLRQNPEVGIPMEGLLLNYATRGCRKGKMYLYSSHSGGGKTRTMVGNACSIAFPRIENGHIVSRQVLEPVLFVATEMQADEIQTLILSWISGVNEEKILLNQLTPDEEYLINIAMNIMEKYEKNFVIEAIPNPSIKSLKSMITNYILHDNIEYIFYDYIFTSVGLMDEFSGVGLREDVVLMMLSNTLKEIAADYNVFVMTGTQLNGTWEGKQVRNANMLRGSKAIADKIDIGVIGVRCTDEELQQVQTYCEEMHLIQPNIVMDIYKNRRGKMCDVKIFRKLDYGTCRATDIIATTTSYKVINDLPELVFVNVIKDMKDYE